MPTGYTCYIEDGSITSGKEFLELCLHNFGIAVDQRDEPLSTRIPDTFTVKPYYIEKVDEALKKLEDVRRLNDDEIRNRIDDEIAKYEESDREYKNATNKKLAAYYEIRKDVSEWVPPTRGHDDIKTFALNQLNMCIDDLEKGLSSSYYEEMLNQIKSQTVEEYRESIIRRAEDDVKYAIDNKRSEEDNVKRKNDFIKAFRKSLEDL